MLVAKLVREVQTFVAVGNRTLPVKVLLKVSSSSAQRKQLNAVIMCMCVVTERIQAWVIAPDTRGLPDACLRESN